MEFFVLRPLLTLLGQITGEVTIVQICTADMFFKIEIVVLVISKIVSFFWSQDYLLYYLVKWHPCSSV